LNQTKKETKEQRNKERNKAIYSGSNLSILFYAPAPRVCEGRFGPRFFYSFIFLILNQSCQSKSSQKMDTLLKDAKLIKIRQLFFFSIWICSFQFWILSRTENSIHSYLTWPQKIDSRCEIRKGHKINRT
jgi:hypothetical protein